MFRVNKYKRFGLVTFCIWMVMQPQFAMATGELPAKLNNTGRKNGHSTKPRLIAIVGRYDASVDTSIDQFITEGNSAASEGRKDDAINYYRKAIALLEKRGNRKSDFASTLIALIALIINDESTRDECKSLCRKAIELSKNTSKKNEGIATLDLANLCAQSNDLSTAERLCNDSLPLIENVYGKKSVLMGTAYYWSADILMKGKKRFSEAEKYSERAVDIFSTDVDCIGWKASALNQLFIALSAQKKWIEAEGVCEQAVNAYEKAYGATDLRIADSLDGLGVIQQALGKNDKGIASWTKALVIRAKHPDEKQTFTYNEGSPNCEHYYKGGALYKKIKGNDIIVEIAAINLDPALLKIDLQIINDSTQPVDVLPSNIRLSFFNPGPHELQRVCVQNFQQTALTANTVAPGHDTVGTLCFQWDSTIQSQTHRQLEIVIGKTTFIL